MAELRPANLTEFFLYVSSTFLYLSGAVVKADPSFLAPKTLRPYFLRVFHFQRSSTPVMNDLQKPPLPQKVADQAELGAADLRDLIEQAEVGSSAHRL